MSKKQQRLVKLFRDLGLEESTGRGRAGPAKKEEIKIEWDPEKQIEIKLLKFFEKRGRAVVGKEALIRSLQLASGASLNWEIALQREHPVKLLYVIYDSDRKIPDGIIEMIINKMTLEDKLKFFDKLNERELWKHSNPIMTLQHDNIYTFLFSDERVGNTINIEILYHISRYTTSLTVVNYLIEKLIERDYTKFYYSLTIIPEPPVRVPLDNIITGILKQFTDNLIRYNRSEIIMQLLDLNYKWINTTESSARVEILIFAFQSEDSALFDKVLSTPRVADCVNRYDLKIFTEYMGDRIFRTNKQISLLTDLLTMNGINAVKALSKLSKRVVDAVNREMVKRGEDPFFFSS